MKLTARMRFKNILSGIAISKIVLGCSTFSLGLGYHEAVTSKITALGTWIFTLTILSSISVICSGGFAFRAAKRTTAYSLMSVLVSSSLSATLLLISLGLQTYGTAWYHQQHATVNSYTTTALVLSCLISGTAWFSSLASVWMACSAGGACNGSIFIEGDAEQPDQQ